jgi:hypothetical protein
MKSKKIMQIFECCLNLPDDFEGTLLDALKLLVQCREEAENKNKINRYEKQNYENDDGFSLLWNNDDIKCLISYGFAELNEDGTDWIYDAEWIKNIVGEVVVN